MTETELPKGWARMFIGDAVKVVRGISFPSSARGPDSEGRAACLRTKNVQHTVEWDDLMFVPEKYISSSEQYVRPGDTLISTANSIELVGKVAYIGQIPRAATIGIFISILRPTTDIDPKFVFFQLSSPKIRSAIRSTASTTTNISNISLSQCLGLDFLVPPLAEQRRIVAEIEKQFTRLDEARRMLQLQRLKLNRYEAAILNSSVHNHNEDTVSFGDLLAVPLRNGHSAKASGDSFGVRAITLSAITEGDFSEANTKITSADPKRVEDLWMRPNDFLFQRGNTRELVGLARLYNGPDRYAIFPDLVIRARTKDTVNREYIEIVLHSPRTRNYIRSRSRGIAGSMPKIDQETIESVPIPLPSREHQDRIAGKVSAARSGLQVLRSQVKRAEIMAAKLRQAILAKAFAGQLVPQDPNEPASILLDRIREQRHEADRSTTHPRRPAL